MEEKQRLIITEMTSQINDKPNTIFFAQEKHEH